MILFNVIKSYLQKLSQPHTSVKYRNGVWQPQTSAIQKWKGARNLVCFIVLFRQILAERLVQSTEKVRKKLNMPIALVISLISIIILTIHFRPSGSSEVVWSSSNNQRAVATALHVPMSSQSSQSLNDVYIPVQEQQNWFLQLFTRKSSASITSGWFPTPSPGNNEQPITASISSETHGNYTYILIEENQLTLHINNGLYVNQRDELATGVVQALEYASGRVKYTQTRPYSVVFTISGNCSLQGVANPDTFTAQVFTCTTIPVDRAIAIMAHELVHLLAFDRYGAPPSIGGDLILVEGLATYGAGTYWLSGYPDFRSYVHDQHAAGRTYPLTATYQGGDVDAMNATYYQWASFVEYLLTQHAPEKFHQLYPTGDGYPGTANYQDVYGYSFAQLEQRWLGWINQ